MVGKGCLPALRQRNLAHGGSRLAFLQLQPGLAEAEAAAAKGDGAGRDDQHLGAARARLGNVTGETFHPCAAQGAVGIDQHGRADLDDQPVSVAQL